jgi:xanthine dehydrogenase large subunit
MKIPAESLVERTMHQFVTGASWFTDDLPTPSNTLHVALGLSTCASGRLSALELSTARASSGVVMVLTAGDVPGINCTSALGHDPVFAGERIEYHGQVLFAVVAESAVAAEAAVRLVQVSIDADPPVITLAQARDRGSLLTTPLILARGNSATAIAIAAECLNGQLPIGGQEHFYMEGQVALALPQPDQELLIVASTQHPAEVQHQVAAVLGLAAKDVTVQCPRLGGGFGGKETQATQFACIAALAAWKTGKPVKLCVPRQDDFRITGKRHDMEAHWRVGFDRDGRLRGLEVALDLRCGYSMDLSEAVGTRALLHLDNAYFIPDVRFEARLYSTNTVSNTAFRGFGAPQAILVIETIIERIARVLQMDPVELRHKNYYAAARGVTTPYGMRVDHNPLPELTRTLLADCDWHQRQQTITTFNARQPILKRGLAFVPVKFGLSFIQTFLNQAGVLLNVYHDGSLRLAHGGTEMGQGLTDKVAAVVVRAFGIAADRLRVVATDTSRVPNASPTAASVSSDLIGQAALNAVTMVRDRLLDFAAIAWSLPRAECTIKEDALWCGNTCVPFDQLVHAAWQARIELAATGFYRTPDIHFDAETLQGQPFHYFVYGVAASEVMIDTLTGETRLLRVDLLQDTGHSLAPEVDRGQVEGAFMQGVGWLLMEELVWSDAGRLLTDGPDTYKIPTASDVPPVFNVGLTEQLPHSVNTVFRSKGIGEPPLPLAVSVHLAIQNAIAAVQSSAGALAAPATPEAVLRVLAERPAHQDVRRRDVESLLGAGVAATSSFGEVINE